MRWAFFDTSDACNDNRPKEMENLLEFRCAKEVAGRGNVLEEPELQSNGSAVEFLA